MPINQSKKSINKFVLGIIGGMGPAATVELQRLIIELTPAEYDQDHIEVITHNNPEIPNRTTSLQNDNGVQYTEAIIASGKMLIKAGANILCMPCITAHARFHTIQAILPIKLINVVELVADYISLKRLPRPVAILATHGSISENVFGPNFSGHGIDSILPDNDFQNKIISVINDTKAGHLENSLRLLVEIITDLKEQEIQTVILGCTELCLYEDGLNEIGITVVNPLRILAENIVQRHLSS